MATRIRWIDNSSVEKGHRIYKSDTYFTKDNLPPMLVELGPDVEEYVDEDGGDGENWYIVSAFINDYEVFSEPFISGLATAFIHDVFGDGSAVATYRFDGDATDLGGNFDGTWSGTEQYTDGVIAQAARFDGTSYVDIPPSSFGDTFNYEKRYSISVWLDSQPAFGFTNGNRNTGFVTEKTTYGLIMALSGNSSGNRNTSEELIPNSEFDGDMHHLVIVKIGDEEFRIFWDGMEYKTISTERTGTGNETNNRIGDIYRSNDSYEGKYDQFRIFNRVLTEQEVQILYQEGAMFL